MIFENPMIIGLIVGALFGATLILSGLANPDKIIGTLRLKDLHAMRTIIVFVIVGMIGTLILGRYGMAIYSVKPAALLSALIGGCILGVGFGLTGFCPGTGLACAITGRIDALITVLGMFAGAYIYIRLYQGVVMPLDKILNYGKVKWPEIIPVSSTVLVTIFTVLAIIALVIMRPKSEET